MVNPLSLGRVGAALFDAGVVLIWAHRPAVWVPLHVGAALAFAAMFGRLLAGRAPVRGAAYLALSLGLAIPVAGPLCALIIGGLLIKGEPASGDLLADFKEHVGIPELPKEEGGSGESVLSDSRQAEPLVDMLGSPDLKTKRAALEALANLRIPALLPHLRAALGDPRPEIYQFAMALLTRLQGEHTGEIARATEGVRRSGGSADAHRALAAACGRYLRSALADESVYGFYEDMMRRELSEAVRLDPADAASWAELGRLALGAGRLDEGRRSFAQALLANSACLPARYGLAELEFSVGDLPALRGRLRELAALGKGGGESEDPRLRLARWWVSGPAEEGG